MNKAHKMEDWSRNIPGFLGGKKIERPEDQQDVGWAWLSASVSIFLCSNLVESSEESYEREDSGDGSGDFLPFKLSRKERQSGPEEPIQNEEEGSSVEFEKYNDIATEPGKPKLPVEDLRKDNIIEWAEICQSQIL